MSHELPKEVHLYWLAGSRSFSLHTSDNMKDYGDWNWLGVASVDFGNVVFDEKELTLKALNKELGAAQGKVNYLKEEIQKLMAIGHEAEEVLEPDDCPVPSRPQHWPLDDTGFDEEPF